MRSALLPLLVLLLSVADGALAAVHGQPLSRRFGADDYQADAINLAVLADADGFVYVGNSRGLLRFDGLNWDLTELPGRSSARALRMGADGYLYIGGYDQFGRARTDGDGRVIYEDLRSRFGLADGAAAFGYVWDVEVSKQGVYFRSDTTLFFIGTDGTTQQWPTDENQRPLFQIGNDIYARINTHGLSRFNHGKFELIAGGEIFAEAGITRVYAEGDHLLVIADGGFYRAYPDRIEKVPGDAEAIFAESDPYAAIQLADGSLALGTTGGELLHFSAELELLGRYRVGSVSVLDLAVDREGGLWVATEGDLVRLQFPSPWSAYTEADGLVGAPTHTAWHAGSLWVATSQGVFRARTKRGEVHFKRALETVLEASLLEPDETGLIVGDREGILAFNPGTGTAERVMETNSVYQITRTKSDPNLMYVVSEDAVRVLGKQATKWSQRFEWPAEHMSLGAITEREPGEIWLDDYRGGVQRWRLDLSSGAIQERRVYDVVDGLEVDLAFGTRAFVIDDSVFAVSGDRVFKLQGERFVPADDAPPFRQVAHPYEMQISSTAQGDFATSPHQLLWRKPGASDWKPLHIGSALAAGFSRMQLDADGMLRVPTWGGVLQFDPSGRSPDLPNLSTGLRAVQLLPEDSRIPQSMPLAPGAPPRVPPGSSVGFDFRLVSMDSGIEFRYRMDGLMTEWSAWTKPSSPALTLRAPPPGLYALHVEGRTGSGRSAKPLRYSFEVLPHWWQTLWARIAAVCLVVLAAGGASYLIARMRYRRYLAANERLERKISERTAELAAANRRLEEIATEDGLTGVANRRALDQALAREWDRCMHLAQSLAVIMVDVDHFKQYNDRFGHLEGDQQLRRVAQELAKHVTPMRELVARFGGEEFGVLLPGLTIEEAAARAESMREAFDREGFATTVSVGVAAVIPSAAHKPMDLVRVADEALYAAKRAGRNRVVRAAA